MAGGRGEDLGQVSRQALKSPSVSRAVGALFNCGIVSRNVLEGKMKRRISRHTHLQGCSNRRQFMVQWNGHRDVRQWKVLPLGPVAHMQNSTGYNTRQGKKLSPAKLIIADRFLSGLTDFLLIQP